MTSPELCGGSGPAAGRGPTRGPRLVKAVDWLPLLVLPTAVWVAYFVFIGLTLGAFGLMTFIFATQMAAGEPVARGLAHFMAAFWAVRLGAAVLVFDVRPYLRGPLHRLGYAGLNFTFVYLLALYAFVVWKGGL